MVKKGRGLERTNVILLTGLLLCWNITTGWSAEIGGLYRDGQLVEPFNVELPTLSAASPSTRAGQLATPRQEAPLAGRVQSPEVSPETQIRNTTFAESAKRAVDVREELFRLEEAQKEGQAIDTTELLQLWSWFAGMEDTMRAELEKIGQRIRDLGLDPVILERHQQTVEAFEQGAREFEEAIAAVLRGEPDAIPRALKILKQLKFREDPPLLSGGLPYQTHVKEAPRLEREKQEQRTVQAVQEGTAVGRPAPAIPQVEQMEEQAGPPLPPGMATEGVILAASPPPPTPADLAATIDVQITPEITAKATELGNSPVAIYEFVRNKVEFQPYLGSRKGSVETLKQLRGNDTDQASLLLALLRAANIPSHYVRGTIEITPDQAKSWLGVDDAGTAASMLTTAGLDGVAIVSGSTVVAVRLTHVWVEAFVPYANYRGVPNDSTGKVWAPLDPSFKGSNITPGMDVLTPMGFNADSFLANYISTFHVPSPIEKLVQDVQTYLDVNDPGKKVVDIERRTEISSQSLGILPASLPFQVLSVSSRFAELEAAKRYKVRFRLYNGGTTFIDHTMNLPEFIGKRVTIEYTGATPADQATIDSFGGIYNTPPNLVNVKPVLELDNVAVATSTNAIGMGRSHSSDMHFTQPVGASNVQPVVQNPIIAGNGQAIAFDTFLDVRNTLISDTEFPPGVILESILHTTALDYLSRVDRGQEQAGRLMQMVTTQDVSEAIVENSIAVGFSFGTPVTFEWTGLTVDADRRIIGPFAVNGAAGKNRPYMILTGMDGSIMENRIFEDRFNQQAVSTIKIVELASDAGIIICTIQTSIGAQCPGFAQPSHITSAVNAAIAAGHVVTIPKAPSTVGQWSGTGYLDMNPTTGAAGYIISGGISGGVQSAAGGATVDSWPITLTCEATAVTGVALQPPADEPDPTAVFCADDTTITFKIRLSITCKDGTTKTQDETLTTHKTKKEFGGGHYELKLIAFGVTLLRKIVIIQVDITDKNDSDAVLTPPHASPVTSEHAAVRTDLGSKLTPNDLNGLTYEWIVGGSRIKTYEHDIDEKTKHKKIDLMAADLTTDKVSFFWTDVGNPVDVKLKVSPPGSPARVCEGVVKFKVEQMADPNNEVYAANGNDRKNPNGTASSYRMLLSHHGWHGGGDMDDGKPPVKSGASWGDVPGFSVTYNGSAFLLWHREFIDAHEEWRKTFHVPPLDPTLPMQALPRPEYLKTTPAPGSTAQSRVYHYVRLGEFQNLDELGRDVVSPWHNSGHGALSGLDSDMGGFDSPRSKNDLFWKWHTAVDGPRKDSGLTTALLSVSTSLDAEIQAASAGDRASVLMVEPDIGTVLTAVPTGIIVVFDRKVSSYAPTANTVQLKAEALKVNGSPATTLTDVGGTTSKFMVYRFTGFATPPVGTIAVELNGTASYEGKTWTLTYQP